MKPSAGMTALARQGLMAAFTVCTVFSLVQIFRGSTPLLSWLGLALATGAPLCGLLTHQGPGRPPLFWTATSGLGLAITMAMSHRFGPAAGVIHVWAGVSLIAWFTWVRWLRPGLNETPE